MEIPCNFNVPEILDCKLIIVDIPYFITKCNCCDNKIKIIPAFITKGTTLTLSAQAFVSVCYHSGTEETWRKLQEKICYPLDGIAHTTIYRSYHALGKNLDESKELLKDVFNENLSVEASNEIPKKAMKAHTKQKENIIIKILLGLLLVLNEYGQTFWNYFWIILEILVYKSSLYKIFQPSKVIKKPINSS